ncbi:MAG: nicotinamide-nucleotide adenylyltransferase [Candidatus Bathyarchaeia archaeon]
MRGLYVGRFQPFHLGHLEAVKALLTKAQELIIIIGSAQRSHDLENPFTAGERYLMVRGALNEAGIPPERYHILAVPDSPMHSVWVAQIISYAPPFQVVYSNDPLTRRLFKEIGITVNPVEFYHREVYSATEVRRRILSGGNWRELVPPSVADNIDRIGGVERLRELATSDSPFGRKDLYSSETLCTR